MEIVVAPTLLYPIGVWLRRGSLGGSASAQADKVNTENNLFLIIKRLRDHSQKQVAEEPPPMGRSRGSIIGGMTLYSLMLEYSLTEQAGFEYLFQDFSELVISWLH